MIEAEFWARVALAYSPIILGIALLVLSYCASKAEGIL